MNAFKKLLVIFTFGPITFCAEDLKDNSSTVRYHKAVLAATQNLVNLSQNAIPCLQELKANKLSRAYNRNLREIKRLEFEKGLEKIKQITFRIAIRNSSISYCRSSSLLLWPANPVDQSSQEYYRVFIEPDTAELIKQGQFMSACSTMLKDLAKTEYELVERLGKLVLENHLIQVQYPAFSRK